MGFSTIIPDLPPFFPVLRNSHGLSRTLLNTNVIDFGSILFALIEHMTSPSRSGRWHILSSPPYFSSLPAVAHTSSTVHMSSWRAIACGREAFSKPEPLVM